MATRKTYVGPIGPLLHDDLLPIDDVDGEFPGQDRRGIVTNCGIVCAGLNVDGADISPSMQHDQNTDTILDDGGANEVSAAEIRSHIDQPLVPVGGLPTPTAGLRGAIVVLDQGAGVEDEVYICVKSAADTYEWVLIVAGTP
jgi:hypothetical protein